MRVSLKTAGVLVAAFCISLWLMVSTSLAAPWIACGLLILAMFLSICFAAGGPARMRCFALAFLGVTLPLSLSDWTRDPIYGWITDFEKSTLEPLQKLLHPTDDLPIYQYSYYQDHRRGDVILQRSADGTPKPLLTRREVESIDTSAIPRVPSFTEFRMVFYSVLFLWLGGLAGFIALIIHRRAHPTAREVQPARAG